MRPTEERKGCGMEAEEVWGSGGMKEDTWLCDFLSPNCQSCKGRKQKKGLRKNGLEESQRNAGLKDRRKWLKGKTIIEEKTIWK